MMHLGQLALNFHQSVLDCIDLHVGIFNHCLSILLLFVLDLFKHFIEFLIIRGPRLFSHRELADKCLGKLYLI